ncbi:MAG: transporter substrate-binding domain-containing protein [Thermodesulfovibrionales bacterium]
MKNILLCYIFFFLFFIPDYSLSFDDQGYKDITVVLDDNYPPYSFKDINNELQGISIDRWRLWEKTTGIKVNIIGTDWYKAQEMIKEGKADVIDTIFKTPERQKVYLFSKPYARIDVPIYVHKNIQGISDIVDLHGFTIGVKEGDAVINILRNRGITSLERFNNYESLIKAVKDKRTLVFTVDKPPAYYLMHKLGIASEIRESFVLYTGEFHMAVLKENFKLLGIIEEGYGQIPKVKLNKINEKWMGKPIIDGVNFRYFIYMLMGFAVTGVFLFVWNSQLRRAVARKTHQLETAMEFLKNSQRNLILMNFAVDSSYNMVFRISKTGVIDYVNNTTCIRLKYAYDEIVGRNISSLSTKQKKIESIIARLQTIKRANIEAEFIDKDGNSFPAELTFCTFDYEGQSYIYVFVKDIKDIKALHDEMLKKEKLQSLALLAGGIAHDFNNLLTVIIGNITILKLNLSDNEEILDLVNKMETAAERAQDLIRKMLIFSKGGTPIKQTTSLRHIINETVSFAMTGSRITCDVLIDEDIRDVDVDVTQIHQVLHNLIVNAIQAMPDGGKITIRSQNENVDETSVLPLSVGEYVKIEISDTGKGISQEDLPKIFDPYFTTKADGSGLGLATVYSIVSNHDGHISVKSTLNKGTTFFIYLPANQKTLDN